MLIKFLLHTTLYLVLITAGFAQSKEQPFMIGIETHFLVGGELNASYDLMLGGRVEYSYKKIKEFDFYASFGGATNLGDLDSRLISMNIQLGTYWRKSKKISLKGGVGVDLMQESHSFYLNVAERNLQKEYLGFTARLGSSIRLMKSVYFNVSIQQTNLNYTSIVTSLNYSF